MKNSARLLVVSPPCHQPVNRAIYRELALQHGVRIHLVVPRKLHVGGVWRDTPPGDPAPYELTLLDLSGTHGRLQTLNGLESLISQWHPTHILVDNDPATLMTRQAANASSDAAIWALTAENLMPHYSRDFLAGIRSAKPARMAGPLLTWILRKRIHPKVDRVFTLSRDGTAVMERLGFAGKTTQIPLGFDPGLFHIQSSDKIAATRTRLGLRARTVAYFGRLTPEKGVHLLLEALATLKDLEWHFLIDHFSDYETPYTSELKEKIASMGLTERVVYFDAKHDEMPDFMNAADIVVLPSISTPKWKEQYGRVVPEAMACGKAVIGSDSGTIPELIGSHGGIFPEGEAGALANRLREWIGLDEASLRQLGERAAAYAHEKLSIKRQAEIWAGLLA